MKTFITPQDLLEKSFELGKKVLEGGCKPTFVISIYRGGTPIGISVQELFKYVGIKNDHISIRTSSYKGTQIDILI